MELKTKDMVNKAMTNEQAIEVIQANAPSEKYYILRDALTLAVKALKMTSRKMNKEAYRNGEESN